MATGSKGRPCDVVKPKRENNQLRPGDGCRAAGVAGVGSQCAIETRTCGIVLRQLSHSIVTDAMGIQEVGSSKQAAEGAGNTDKKELSVTTTHTSPCLQKKPPRRHSIEILWTQEGMAL